MDLDPSVLWDFAGEVVGTVKPRPRGVPATVTRVDADGTVWVTTGDGTEAPAATCGAGVSVGDVVSVEWSGAQMGVTANTSDPSAGSRAVGAVQRAVRAARSVADGAQAIANAIGQHFWADDNGAHVSTEAGNAIGARNILMNSLGILLRQEGTWLASFSDSAVAFFDGLGNTAANVVAQFGADGSRVGADPTWQTVATYFEQDGMKVRTRNGFSPFALYDLAGIVATGGLVRQRTVNSFVSDWSCTLDFTPATGTDIALIRYPSTVGIQEQSFVAGTAETYEAWYGTTVYDGDRSITYTANDTHTTKPRGSITITYKKYASADNPTLFVGPISDEVPRAARTASVGEGIQVKTENQIASGKYNDNQSTNAFEIGNGTADNARSNAFAVDWDGNLTAGNFRDAAMTADLGSSGTVRACRIGSMLVMSGVLGGCTVSDTYTWTHLAHLDPSALGITLVTSMGATVEVSGGGPSYAGTTNAGGTARIVDGVLYADMQANAAFSNKFVKFLITAYVE